MNKKEKELLKKQLEKEKEIIASLKKVYQQAEKGIQDKIDRLLADELTQSKIYQAEYQQALRGQIDAILDNMDANNYDNIMDYLKGCYEDGYIGSMYNLAGQGIPLIMPIDQEAVVKAIQLDSKISEGLYTKLGINTKELKKSISSEVARGISGGFTYQDMARNLNNQMKIGQNKSIRIARTEGHRVTQEATMDGMRKAKDNGADIVKQWDSTLDGKTRPSHQRVDGEVKEMDEAFSNGLDFPGDPNGSAKEVVNCRCVLLQRAKWALDEDELETLKKRAEDFGLDKTSDFEDFKKKYLKAVDKSKENVDNVIEDIKVPRNLGAAGKKYPVQLPSGGHSKLQEGSTITKIKVIAGKGTDTEIRDAVYLEADYKVPAEKWMKVRGEGYVIVDKVVRRAELHWYEAEDKRVEMKVKRYFDDES